MNNYIKKAQYNKIIQIIRMRSSGVPYTDEIVDKSNRTNVSEKKAHYSLKNYVAGLLKQAMYKAAVGPDDLPRDSSGSTILDRQRYSYWNPTHPENQTRQNMNYEYGVPIGEYKEPEEPEWIKHVRPYAERRKEFLTTDGKDIDRSKLSVRDAYISEPFYRITHGIKSPLHTWFKDDGSYGATMDAFRMVGDSDDFATQQAADAKSPWTSQIWWMTPAMRGPLFFADVAEAGVRQDMMDEKQRKQDALVRKAREDQARDQWNAMLKDDPTYPDRLRRERIIENIAAKQMVATERALAGSNMVEKQLGVVPEDEPELIFSDAPKTAYDPIDIPAAQEPKIELDPAMVAPIQLPENYEERAIVDAPDKPYDMTIAKHP